MSNKLATVIDRVASETDFSGVVRVDRGGLTDVAVAYGMAHRAHQIGNTVDTRFAIASGSKGLTALAVVSLIEDGTLQLSTTARSILGADLPLIADDVTVEHLLSHQSGIGDYIDEEAGGEITDYVMPVSVHQLVATEDFLNVIDGFPQKSPAGERFEYNNGGFVVLALIAERSSGVPYHELIRTRVTQRAGMVDSAFLRSDELPGGVATGYLSIDGVSRSNVFHLPVLGTGDGGLYTTVADVHAMWAALFEGRIVSPEWVAEMVRSHVDVPPGDERYGLGFWLAAEGPGVILKGYDAGVSFKTMHDPTSALTYTVIANTDAGAWPVARAIAAELG